ncbi:hypothetical protein GCM10022631_14270 [Deinococcus rubellus]|uniref:hypothetical protein n=1 Tax=Deinococcus rubellus TaxID=1889240 RepID=UPI0031EC9FED
MDLSPLQFCPRASPYRPPVRCLPPPETWTIQTGRTDDLHLVAHVQAQAYRSLTGRSEQTQQPTALCEPGTALFVLESECRSPLAFCVWHRHAGRPGVALISLTPDAFVQAASRLLRCVEMACGQSGGGCPELDFPNLLPELNRAYSTDLPGDASVTGANEAELSEVLARALPASPWNCPKEDHAGFRPHRAV